MGEARRKELNGKPPPATPPLEPAKDEPPQQPPPGVLTMEDVNVLLGSYQQQIMQKAGEVASMAMELARRDRTIAAMKAEKTPK